MYYIRSYVSKGDLQSGNKIFTFTFDVDLLIVERQILLHANNIVLKCGSCPWAYLLLALYAYSSIMIVIGNANYFVKQMGTA